MKYNSTIAIFLLAASLLTAAMTSCGDAGTETKTTDAVTVGETAAVTEPTEETRTPHKVDVDTLDFGGESPLTKKISVYCSFLDNSAKQWRQIGS